MKDNNLLVFEYFFLVFAYIKELFATGVRSIYDNLRKKLFWKITKNKLVTNTKTSCMESGVISNYLTTIHLLHLQHWQQQQDAQN